MTSTILQLSETGQTVGLRDEGAGAPVLLVHGVGLQSEAWAPQIDALSRCHRVLAVDLPGHGDSADLMGGTALPDYVAWLRKVVDALGCGPVSLAGHSMGALIAGGFAIEHPDLTRRVALLNGVYRRSAEARRAVVERAEAIRAGDIDHSAPLMRWFGDSPADQNARPRVAKWLSTVAPGGYGAAYTAFAAGDTVYADRYPQIRCPFLALTGDGDPNSTPEMSRLMAQAVPGGQARIIAGHRHMVNLTAPGEVTNALSDWLAWDEATEAAQ